MYIYWDLFTTVLCGNEALLISVLVVLYANIHQFILHIYTATKPEGGTERARMLRSE